MNSRANLFVPHTSSHYKTMLARAETADPSEFQYGQGLLSKVAGIWIPLAWWDKRSSPARQSEAAG